MKGKTKEPEWACPACGTPNASWRSYCRHCQHEGAAQSVTVNRKAFTADEKRSLVAALDEEERREFRILWECAPGVEFSEMLGMARRAARRALEPETPKEMPMR